jgi:hypothetical protein
MQVSTRCLVYEIHVFAHLVGMCVDYDAAAIFTFPSPESTVTRSLIGSAPGKKFFRRRRSCFKSKGRVENESHSNGYQRKSPGRLSPTIRAEQLREKTSESLRT